MQKLPKIASTFVTESGTQNQFLNTHRGIPLKGEKDERVQKTIRDLKYEKSVERAHEMQK